MGNGRLLVRSLFDIANVALSGQVPWKAGIPYRGAGVYVVSVMEGHAPAFDLLTDVERTHWIAGQDIVYIGRSKQLRRRLKEFYRHIYGRPSPHKGGQSLLQLGCPMLVSWGAADDYAAAEYRMIEAFKHLVGGKKPFANKMRAARMKQAAA